jgi:ribosomal protein L21E
MFKTLLEHINQTIGIYFVSQRQHRAVNVAIYVKNRKKHINVLCAKWRNFLMVQQV